MAFLGHKRAICSFSFLALMAVHAFGADPDVMYALVDASDPTKGATTTFEVSSVAGFASAVSTINAWTAARMADLQGKGEADSLYQAAEELSIKNNIPYMTATILYHRSLLKGAKDADDLKLRCKNAFELMGLPNNAKRCGE